MLISTVVNKALFQFTAAELLHCLVFISSVLVSSAYFYETIGKQLDILLTGKWYSGTQSGC